MNSQLTKRLAVYTFKSLQCSAEETAEFVDTLSNAERRELVAEIERVYPNGFPMIRNLFFNHETLEWVFA